MANKTILQVLHTLNVGGAEILAAAIARQLQNEFCFEFVCLDELGEMGQALKSDGFKVHVLNRKPGFDRGCAQQLFDIYRSSGASLIHAHQYTPFFYAICAAVLKRRPPVLFTEHGRFHPDLPSKKRFVFNRLLLRKTDHVAAVGEAVKQALVQNEGIPGKRIEVIYNGIELSRFQLRDRDSVRKSIRQSLGLNDDQFVATIVGRLDYLKDHITAVKSPNGLSNNVPTFDYCLLVTDQNGQKLKRKSDSDNWKRQFSC